MLNFLTYAENKIEDDKKYVYLKVEKIALINLVKSIEKQCDLQFVYSPVNEVVINKFNYEGDQEELLTYMEKEHRVNFKRIGDKVIINGEIPVLPKPQVKQTFGRIEGTVVDETGEPMIGVLVFIKGSKKGGITDIMGGFELLNVPTGEHEVIAQFVSYKQAIQKVVVSEGSTAMIQFQMKPDSKELKEVVVRGTIEKEDRDREEVLIAERRNSVLQITSIGAQEMSRKGLSNAEAAVSSMAGIAKQRGQKNVMVRGLGDRYNQVTFNGLPIPSEDPLYKNVDLAFFSSEFVQAIDVKKILSSDLYGDVAGASIDISSKVMKEDFEFTLSTSAGVNTEAMNQNFLLPEGIREKGIGQFGFVKPKEWVMYTDETRYHEYYPFQNNFESVRQNETPINKDFTMTIGKRFLIGKQKNTLSLYGVATYDNSFSYRNYHKEETRSGGVYNVLAPVNSDNEKYTQNFAHLLMGNATYQTEKARLAYNYMMVHSLEQYQHEGEGSFAWDASSGLRRQAQIADNTLQVHQFLADYKMTPWLKVSAGVGLNSIFAQQPDRRSSVYYHAGTPEEQLYMISWMSGAYTRDTQIQTTDELNINTAIEIRLGERFDNISSLKIGYQMRSVKDYFLEESYNHIIHRSRESWAYDDIDMSSIINPDTYGLTGQGNTQFSFVRWDPGTSEFDAEKSIKRVFGMLTWQWSPRFTTVAGLGVDNIYSFIEGESAYFLLYEPKPMEEQLLTPSFNMKYNINDRNTLRFGYSKNYTLPVTTESALYVYKGIDVYRSGNPDLELTKSHNVDLTWDLYPKAGELISLTAFYKHLDKPILSWLDIFQNTTSAQNAASAEIFGLELDIRKQLFSVVKGSKEQQLSLGYNMSYIRSRIDPTNTANPESDLFSGDPVLEGATPWMIKSDLTYSSFRGEKGIQITALFDWFSERVVQAGSGGNENTREKGIPRLDLIASYNITKNLAVKLKARNLIDAKYKLVRDVGYYPTEEDYKNRQMTMSEDYVVEEFRLGRDIRLGIDFRF
ncbi:TonB-dependent receptor [Flammeovirga aprica]|uniref:TonB-dependent receptor n=1 Tax=Flammeovirga aprica JL-4 TaxID=694437 RepID=A0A7X9RSQ9_9BACT|nr:TonB-dependent receptor [Flammeovirga aprica]NME67530.1 TonB-dependent receptor [Flammeovirga aprica JL-4]